MPEIMGVLVHGGSTEVAEVVGLAGATHVLFDYGAVYRDESLAADLSAAAAVGVQAVVVPPVWRVEWVRAAITLGASGIMLPSCTDWNTLRSATLMAREMLMAIGGAGAPELWGQLAPPDVLSQPGPDVPSVVMLRRALIDDAPPTFTEDPVRGIPGPLRVIGFDRDRQIEHRGCVFAATDLAVAHMASIEVNIRDSRPALYAGEGDARVRLTRNTRMDLVGKLRKRLVMGEFVLGAALTAPNDQMAAAYAAAGDYVAINQEHSPSESEIGRCINTVWAGGSVPIVVTRSIAREYIWQAVRAGAGGIEVPNIDNAQDVESVLTAMREAQQWMPWAGGQPKQPLLVAHIERRECLEHLSEIAAVEGLDVLLIGSWDLSQALGCPGDFADERYTTAERDICRIVNSSPVALGALVSDNSAEGQLEKGATWLLAAWQTGVAGEFDKLDERA